MAVQILSVSILARLLDPADYGLLAMAVVIVGVGEIFRDFGLSSAAIQAPTLSRHQRDNLFWINTGIGLVLASVVIAGAQLIAAFYRRPELVGVARALSGTFVLNGLATQYRADLVRRLAFARLAVADVSAPIVALSVAVVTALSGWGYWALVAQNLTQAATLLIILAVGARWLPSRPRRGVPMRELLTFGWRLVGTQLIGYASNNIDTLTVALRFGPGPLGYYNRAFRLLMAPLSQLRAPTTTIALPVLARLSDDEDRYSAFVLRGQLAFGYTIVAGLAVVAAAAEPVTDVFLGASWTAVAPILRLLALAGIFQTLAYVGYWVYLSRNLTRDLLRFTLVEAVVRLACILTGSHWGVVGVAAGYATAPALTWSLSIWWLSRRTVFPARALIVGALRILATAAAAAAMAALVSATLSTAPALVRLAAAAGAAAAMYGLAALAIRRIRQDLRTVLEILRLGARRESSG
jgi:PST family polysaccharide transporter